MARNAVSALIDRTRSTVFQGKQLTTLRIKFWTVLQEALVFLEYKDAIVIFFCAFAKFAMLNTYVWKFIITIYLKVIRDVRETLTDIWSPKPYNIRQEYQSVSLSTSCKPYRTLWCVEGLVLGLGSAHYTIGHTIIGLHEVLTSMSVSMSPATYTIENKPLP